MGQKANPIGNRLGIIRGWESNWYGNKKDFAQKLIEDHKIRTYLNARINKGGIAKIVIERTLGKLIITIHTSKPGIIIGKGGGEVDRIKEELKKLTGKEDVQINILEIRRPELDAQIVADTIARQLEGRINFKRAVKMAILEVVSRTVVVKEVIEEMTAEAEAVETGEAEAAVVIAEAVVVDTRVV